MSLGQFSVLICSRNKTLRITRGTKAGTQDTLLSRFLSNSSHSSSRRRSRLYFPQKSRSTKKKLRMPTRINALDAVIAAQMNPSQRSMRRRKSSASSRSSEMHQNFWVKSSFATTPKRLCLRLVSVLVCLSPACQEPERSGM